MFVSKFRFVLILLSLMAGCAQEEQPELELDIPYEAKGVTFFIYGNDDQPHLTLDRDTSFALRNLINDMEAESADVLLIVDPDYMVDLGGGSEFRVYVQQSSVLFSNHREPGELYSVEGNMAKNLIQLLSESHEHP
ncbi:hypothetical protein JCM19037_675 [Geomicrobium sp. JCM 19037]|uniref:hypothetical protein n=1 Tax=unclassified Geomicrobium TaxID=2628951 RepID=UPI00045F168B|nr:hypothetical protein [Geomicrobium sp. JCM 19037]GAK02442.1 hypothetical protein JCM19037_675 [Geomicrobium sp. JCM 19037]